MSLHVDSQPSIQKLTVQIVSLRYYWYGSFVHTKELRLFHLPLCVSVDQPQYPLSDGKVDTSSGSYLHYSALKANRPILPKPVQLTITEPVASPVPGQPAPKETLTGHCDACNVSFESRAAARAHVFSPSHLATLRTTNFGQPASLVNKNSSQVPLSPAVTSPGAGSEGEIVIELPPSTATSNS